MISHRQIRPSPASFSTQKNMAHLTRMAWKVLVTDGWRFIVVYKRIASLIVTLIHQYFGFKKENTSNLFGSFMLGLLSCFLFEILEDCAKALN